MGNDIIIDPTLLPGLLAQGSANWKRNRVPLGDQLFGGGVQSIGDALARQAARARAVDPNFSFQGWQPAQSLTELPFEMPAADREADNLREYQRMRSEGVGEEEATRWLTLHPAALGAGARVGMVAGPPVAPRPLIPEDFNIADWQPTQPVTVPPFATPPADKQEAYAREYSRMRAEGRTHEGATHWLNNNPTAINRTLLQDAGIMLGRSGRVLEAGLGDLAEGMRHLTHREEEYDPWGNLWAYGKNPDGPLPIEQKVEEADGAARLAGKGVLGFAKVQPRIALGMALGGAGAPSMLAAGLPMLVTDEGKIDPVGAAIASLLPGVSKVGGAVVAQALSKIPVAEVVVKVLGQNAGVLQGKVVQRLGKMALSNDTFRRYLEAGGGTVAANAYLLAMQSPRILALPPEQRLQAVLDQVAEGVGPSLLGFVGQGRGGTSRTLELLKPGLQAEFASEMTKGKQPMLSTPAAAETTTGTPARRPLNLPPGFKQLDPETPFEVTAREQPFNPPAPAGTPNPAGEPQGNPGGGKLPSLAEILFPESRQAPAATRPSAPERLPEVPSASPLAVLFSREPAKGSFTDLVRANPEVVRALGEASRAPALTAAGDEIAPAGPGVGPMVALGKSAVQPGALEQALAALPAELEPTARASQPATRENVAPADDPAVAAQGQGAGSPALSSTESDPYAADLDRLAELAQRERGPGLTLREAAEQAYLETRLTGQLGPEYMRAQAEQSGLVSPGIAVGAEPLRVLTGAASPLVRAITGRPAGEPQSFMDQVLSGVARLLDTPVPGSGSHAGSKGAEMHPGGKPGPIVPTGAANTAINRPPPVRQNPVSKAILTTVFGPLRSSLDVALNAIDFTHDDGVLPQVALIESYDTGRLGYICHKNTGQGLATDYLGVLGSGYWPALTTLHEIGHMIDLEALGPKGQYGSRAGTINNVLDAIKGSQAFNNLRAKAAMAESEYDQGRYDYLTLDTELWARAYAQYVTEASQHPELLADLARVLRTEESRQWTTEDFRPIREQIDKLFKAKGWR